MPKVETTLQNTEQQFWINVQYQNINYDELKNSEQQGTVPTSTIITFTCPKISDFSCAEALIFFRSLLANYEKSIQYLHEKDVEIVNLEQQKTYSLIDWVINKSLGQSYNDSITKKILPLNEHKKLVTEAQAEMLKTMAEFIAQVITGFMTREIITPNNIKNYEEILALLLEIKR